ncbi:MAG TPA: DNA alkylation repair protein [Planctomycetota bacterium]|nr:DNA alkylation repair protein [Planctomycetota bacterium]
MRRPRTRREARVALAAARRCWRAGRRDEAVTLAARCGPALDDRAWRSFLPWLDRAPTPALADRVARELFGAMVRRDHTWLRVLAHWAGMPSARRRRASVLAVLDRVRLMHDREAGEALLAAIGRDRAAGVRGATAELQTLLTRVGPAV